jgi:hypothetical protein
MVGVSRKDCLELIIQRPYTGFFFVHVLTFLRAEISVNRIRQLSLATAAVSFRSVTGPPFDSWRNISSSNSFIALSATGFLFLFSKQPLFIEIQYLVRVTSSPTPINSGTGSTWRKAGAHSELVIQESDRERLPVRYEMIKITSSIQSHMSNRKYKSENGRTRTSEYIRGGIRYHGGVSIPCRSIKPAVSPFSRLGKRYEP